MVQNKFSKRVGLLSVLFILLILFACSKHESSKPKELKLRKELYSQKVSHTFGPGGINHSITIYELPKDVIAQIQSSGLTFLNNLPSVLAQKKSLQNIDRKRPYWVPFMNWQETPVHQDDNWIRKKWVVGIKDKPFLGQFIGKKNDSAFIQSIPIQTLDLINYMIQTPQNYYAYGGYRNKCVLIVSVEQQKALYLFRD